MPYATRSDLTTFSLPASALTNVTTAKQDAALVAASDIANGYLNLPYRLPLTAYGSDLKKAVCDIAALMIMKQRGFNPEQADADMLVSSERAAIKWFEGIAAGKIKPYGITDSSPNQTNAEDAADGSHPSYVVQLREAGIEEDDTWEGTTEASGAGVGTPRRRGW